MLQHRLIPKFFLNDRLVIYPIWKKKKFRPLDLQVRIATTKCIKEEKIKITERQDRKKVLCLCVQPATCPLNCMSYVKTQRCLYLAHYISWDWVITYFVNWGPYYSLGWCYVTVIATIYIVFDPGDKRLQIREYLAFKSASHIYQKGQVFWISFRYDWPWSEPVYFILIYVDNGRVDVYMS